MRFSARVFSLFFLFLVSVFFFVGKKQALAYDQLPTAMQNNQFSPNTNPDVPQNLHTYTQSVLIELMSATICQLTGTDPISTNHKCLGVDPKSGKMGFVSGGGGAIGMMENLISYTFIPPTTTGDYVKYLSRNFGISKKAYAADCASPDPTTGKIPTDFGFCSVQPLTDLWISMRDIVYLLFVVIFIVIGVAIMLRVHIDPRTVMTIENQIPKIIIGIILVTFSLAIAGFLIDIMYVAIYLIGSILGPHIPPVPPDSSGLAAYGTLARSSSPFGLGILNSFFNIASDISSAASGIIRNAFPIFNAFSIDVAIVHINLGDIVIQIFVWVLAVLAIFYAILRITMSLIIAYVSILVDIVFAPFWFLAGLIPGAEIGTSGWFKDMLANLAVFPTTIAMFTLAVIFAHIGDNGNLFSPPLLGGLTTTDASGIHTLGLGKIIEFGFIFMTPEALKIVKSALKAPKLNLGPVFQPLGAAGGALGAGAGTIGAFAAKTPQLGERGRFTAVSRRIFKF